MIKALVMKEKIVLLLLEDGNLKAGTAASGNDNTSADPEILVAMGGLSAALGAESNILSVDFEGSSLTLTRIQSDFDLVYTFDENVTVTSSSNNKLITQFQTK